MSSTPAPADHPAPLPPWRRPAEAPVGDDDVAWARRFLARWRVARAVLVVLVVAGAGAAVRWALTASHTACARRADERLALLQDALARSVPLPEGEWRAGRSQERLLVLTDGAVLVDGDRIVAGGPACPAPLW
jgi:hypothetical protein